MKKFFCLISGLFFCLAYLKAQSGMHFQVARLFSDNMVLQQGCPVPVWGVGHPGQRVTIRFQQYACNTTADSGGKWIVYLPALRAGGPYELTVEGGERISFHNVMVGEVWFASGQSNMNFRISRPVLRSEEVIREANYPEIREFHVPENASSHPLEDLPSGGWEICSPQTVGEFSAVGYFFARSLYLHEHVPIGIIHCSVSGTPAEAWLSGDMLRAHPDFKDRLPDPASQNEDWERLQLQSDQVSKQYQTLLDTTRAGLRAGVTQLHYQDGMWHQADYPLFAARLGMPDYRLIWVRKTFHVKRVPEHSLLRLDLGEIKMQNVVYINGIEVGRSNREEAISYALRKGVLKKGENVIAIRWLSEWSYGRLGNPTDSPAIKTHAGRTVISLRGPWKFNGDLEPALPLGKNYRNNPTALYNAMVAPVIPFAIKGVLWYQGEGNAGRWKQYQSLLRLLINDWRIRWKEGFFPFLIVQLPNFTDGGNNWVRLREAQASALAYPNVGLVVTTDIGDSIDLHPKNKRPVGERLFATAEKLAYGRDNGSSGPLFRHMQVESDTALLYFTGGDIVQRGDSLGGFTIAGENRSFYPGHARIEGHTVKVWSPDVAHPAAVRYNWEANPHGTLYNREGYPAMPFRTDRWEE